MEPLKVHYNDEEYNKLYAELNAIHVIIPADPIALGFSGLSNLISEVQGHRERVSSIESDIIRIHTNALIQRDACKHNYETNLAILMDTDPEVMNQPSDKTKVAKANKKLTEYVEQYRQSVVVYRLINTFYDTVKNKSKMLSVANDNIKEQCNIYKRLNPPTGGGYQPQGYQQPPKTYPGNGEKTFVRTEPI